MAVGKHIGSGEDWVKIEITELEYDVSVYEYFSVDLIEYEYVNGEFREKPNGHTIYDIRFSFSGTQNEFTKVLDGLRPARYYETRVYYSLDGETTEPLFGILNPMYTITFARKVDYINDVTHPDGVFFLWKEESRADYYIIKAYPSNQYFNDSSPYYEKKVYPSAIINGYGMVLIDTDLLPSLCKVGIKAYEKDISSKTVGYEEYRHHRVLNKPSISVSDSGHVNISGRDGTYTILEYERTDTSSRYPYSKYLRDFFMDTMFNRTEQGLDYVGKRAVLKKWDDALQEIKIIYKNGASGYENITEQYVQEWCDEFNSITGQNFRISQDDFHTVELQIGSKSDFGWSSQSGSWSSPTWGEGETYAGVITASYCKVAVDASPRSFKSVLWEELTQATGCGYDQFYEQDTLHFDFAVGDITSNVGLDKELLQLLYTEDLKVGDVRAKVARDINARNHVRTSSSGYQLEFLIKGANYRVRAWNVDGDWNFSKKTNWVYFTSSVGSEKWSWKGLNPSGSKFNLTASQWNEFADKVNELRVTNGYSEYNFEPAVSGEPLKGSQFMYVAKRLHDVTGNVALDARYTYKGEPIYRWYFDNLEAAYNSMV